MTKNRTQMIKGVVLMAAAVAALATGIHKGGQSVFFGIVIGLVCGLVGFLFMKGEERPPSRRKAKKTSTRR